MERIISKLQKDRPKALKRKEKDDNFYSALTTENFDDKRSKSNKKQRKKKLEEDISKNVYKNIENAKNMLYKYHKTTETVRREPRSVTPNYKAVVPNYKSKMWDSKAKYSNSGGYKTNSLSEDKIENYLMKSNQLYTRAKIKENNIDQSRNIIGLNPEEEISDMLIDSIMYKVNALQNII